MSPSPSPSPEDARAGLFPALLRHWRTRRGLSQLDLAIAADVSSRHVSFLETGRSAPSAEMVVRLASPLEVPLRAVNAMLRAAGHEPWYPENAPDEPLPPGVASAVALMKQHHEPFPLVVLDRSYRLVDANGGASALLAAATAHLDSPDLTDVNLVRFAVDPALGGRVIANYEQVAQELVDRAQRELLADPDNQPLRDLLDTLPGVTGPTTDWTRPDPTVPSEPTMLLRLRMGEETWSFVVVLSALLAPLEVSLDEMRIEQWFPADAATEAGCGALASGGAADPV